jgi:predicted ribosomally synthesized peptide with nif11-like leader
MVRLPSPGGETKEANMSIEAVEAFREKVQSSEDLQAALQACVTSEGSIDPESIVGVGRQNGFDFSAADVDAILAKDGDELSEFELELVAAGQANSGKIPGV